MTVYKIKRIYESPESDDGYRVLVDRLWPRGISKERAALDEWAKDIAPTNDCLLYTSQLSSADNQCGMDFARW